MQDIGLMIAAIYLSSFAFVIIPLLGLISGSVAGWLMSGVSISQGAVVGLISGLLVLVVILLMGLATPLVSQDIPSFVGWIIALSPAVLALAVPVLVLQVIRIRRGKD